MISNHLVFHLRIIGEGAVLTVIKPGDLVRVHDRHDNIGTVIGTSDEVMKIVGGDDNEETIKLPIAMVLWAVDPPEQYIYRSAASYTSVTMQQSSHISAGYVYAPYIPLQVTPTRFIKSCKFP